MKQMIIEGLKTNKKLAIAGTMVMAGVALLVSAIGDKSVEAVVNNVVDESLNQEPVVNVEYEEAEQTEEQ